MRNILKTIFFIVVLLGYQIRGSAQNTGACNNNNPVCPATAFQFTATGGTQGLSPGLNISNPNTPPTGTNSGCMLGTPGNIAVNPQWLVINVTSSGNLGFIIGPCGSANPQTSYMHWAMWLYTPSTCANIFANTQAPVACNYNTNASGGTGMGPVPGCGAFNANFVPTIPVTAGQQYLLLVSNVSGLSHPQTIVNNGTAAFSCNPLTIPNATACPNQVTTITATWSGASNTTYSVYSSAPTIYPASPTSTVTFTVSAPATRVYTVFANGVNSVGVPITATQQFTLFINPTSTLSVSHNTNYCSFDNATITLAPCQGTFYLLPGAPNMGAQSSTNCAMVLPNNATGLLSPQNNGVYTFSANFATGCVGTVTAQINVAPDNFITISGTGGTSTVEVCQGGTANFSASMPTATSYTLLALPGSTCVNGSSSITVNGAVGNFALTNVQPACAGIYTVIANINYNGIKCLRSATVDISVVTTHTITVIPTYTFCQGTPACITASAVGTGTNSFAWNGPGFTSNLQSPCITNSVLPVNNGVYNVSAAFSNGGSICYTYGAVNVIVVAVNPVSALVPSLICQYSTANLAINAPNGNGTTVTYYEMLGPNAFSYTGTTNAVPPIANVQPIASGLYTANVVYAIGTRTCPASGYGQMVVIPVNSVAVQSPVKICYPGRADLYSNAVSATSYSWAGPLSYTASGPNQTLYYTPISTSGIYTVYVGFNNGGISCFNTATVDVSINPVMSFTLPDLLRGCYNQTVEVDGPLGATGYSWTSSTGYTSNNPNLILSTIQPTQSGVYALNVSLGPCVSSRSVQIEVLSQVDFSLTPKDREVCKGDTVLLEAGAIGGSENYAYDWNPYSYLNAPTGSIVVGVILGTTIFNVSVRDIACPEFTKSNAFTVLVKQPPIPNLTPYVTEGCDPLCIVLNPRTTGQATITTFDYGGFAQFQGDSNRYCFPNPGVYYPRIISVGANGCKGVYNLPDPITVHPRSSSQIRWSPDVPTTTDNLVTFSSISKYTTSSTYYWMFSGTAAGDYDTSVVKNPQRSYNETGKYPIMLITTTEFGCVDTTITFLEIKDDLNVYIPNSFTPNGDGINDQFFVKGLGFKTDNFYMEIFDRWNHSVFSTTDVNKGWDGTVKGAAPTQGLYIYKVRVIGANGEGRKEYIGHVTLIR